jgi:hypothetical protein
MKASKRRVKGGPLTVREAGGTERGRIEELLAEKHPQHAPKRVGHELRMVIEQGGEWVQHVRNHWAAVENRHRWRKNTCLREDHTRSRHPNLVGALALLRSALFAIHQPHHEHYGGLNAFTEAVAAGSLPCLSPD